MAHSEKDQDKKTIESFFEGYIQTAPCKADLKSAEPTTDASAERLKLEWVPRAYRDLDPK